MIGSGLPCEVMSSLSMARVRRAVAMSPVRAAAARSTRSAACQRGEGMAATLLGAIQTLWNVAGGPSDRGLGALWFEEAREGIAFPYAVLDQVKEDETLMDAENGKEVKSRWRVTIYDTGALAAESFGGIIETAFDGKTLDV